MGEFHQLTLSGVSKSTADCTVLSFNVPEELKDAFAYQHGQYLTLKKDLNGQEIRRSYSLCSSSVDNKWEVAVKRIPDGVFSNYANDQLSVGDSLDVMTPMGAFTSPITPDATKSYALFAAGSGITPVMSIAKTVLALEPNSTIKLFYLNKNSSSIIFKDELEELKNKYAGRLEVYHFLTQEQLSEPLFNGRFNKEKLQEIANNYLNLQSLDHCFVCGPQKMTFLIKDELVALGLDANKVHFELFYVDATDETCSTETASSGGAVTNDSDHTMVTIIERGEKREFQMSKDGETVLEVATEKGLDIPFSCQSGVCCTCMGKVIEGSVEMKTNFALGEDEMDKGFVLVCQSVPTSDVLVIDFDQN
ncbi:MAG: 2Fe-2S iron-sulfur cluster binding domain-containing protein [Flavobacteriales bacterium]|nr:2Fe-2S iron-sulfur cluster binding domain-containing protein [Flavobacteriales bacterium]